MKKFWNWVKNEDDRTLYFDGYIAQDSWFDDDITPKKIQGRAYCRNWRYSGLAKFPRG